MALTTTSVSDTLGADFLAQPGNSLIPESSPTSPSQAVSIPEAMTQMWSAPTDPPATRFYERLTQALDSALSIPLEHGLSALIDTIPETSISTTLSTRPHPTHRTQDLSTNFNLSEAMTNTYSSTASKPTPSVPTSIETLTLIPTPSNSTDSAKSSKPSSGGSATMSVSIIAMTAAALLCLWILGSLDAVGSGL